MDNIPFPQADDFGKIIKLVNINDVNDLSNDEVIKVVLGEVSDRQVNYYVSAATFLGILTTVKRKRQFTDFGNYLRKCNSVLQEIELVASVLRLPVFSRVFALEKILCHQEVSDIAVLIKEEYPHYSDAICTRRAQTVLKWVEWVISKMNE